MTARLLLLVITCFATVQSARAEGVIDKRLKLTVVPRFGAVRGQAPLPLRYSLSWSEPQLLEGHLRLKWFVEQTLLGTYTAPEVALSSGSVTRNVLLPPVIMPYEDALFSVQGEFVTRDQVYDLDVHDVFIPLDWRRTFVAAIAREPPLQMEATTSGDQVGGSALLTETLRLERFIREPMRSRELSTMVVEVDPEHLPTNPLEFLGFDILLIPAENVATLSDEFLTAATCWVRAGGSLCIFVDGALNPEVLDFLNGLTGPTEAEGAYLRTGAGRLLPVDGEPAGIDEHHCELGRLVVARGPIDSASEEWQRAMLFLWKVRQARYSDWKEGQQWNVASAPDEYGHVPELSFQPNRGLANPWMTELLLPQSIQGIPFVTVCGILALFLLMIAPGDYFLLGRLKRRRWTWVLFPVISLVFTFLMIQLAEAHLGSANLERSITIIDISSQGRPLRSTRIELLYPAFSREVTSEHQATWMVPVDPDTQQSNEFRGLMEEMPDYEPPWDYAGLLPGRHVVLRNVRQWSPRLSRTTTLGETSLVETAPLNGIDWKSITWETVSSEQTLAALHRSVQRFDPDGEMTILGDTLNAPLDRAFELRERVFNFVQFITYIGDSQLFDLVSQISPTAAGHWDDLALMDWGGDKRVFLAFTEPRDGHFVVYRKLLIRGE